MTADLDKQIVDLIRDLTFYICSYSHACECVQGKPNPYHARAKAVLAEVEAREAKKKLAEVKP